MDITFKQVQNGDEAALFALFASVRAEELAMAGWDERLRETVLRQQFHAWRHGYHAAHPRAGETLIVVEGRAAGWAVLDGGGEPWHLVDIAVDRAWRRMGVATRAIRGWQIEAAAAGCGIALSLLRTNAPARVLYDRLGFHVTGESATHWRMEWRP